MSNDGPSSAFEAGQLNGILRTLDLKDVLRCDDFNARIGKEEVSQSEELQQFVGKYLSHDSCNSNGDSLLFMVQLFDRQVLTTFRHRYTTTTWYLSGLQSQIDHVLQPLSSNYDVASLRGVWTRFSIIKSLLSS